MRVRIPPLARKKFILGKIFLLSPEVISKIAAGEVIERPASVVKETIENSLDAGATHISITAEEGGKKRIVVTDNGEGMDEDDVRNCLHRYSTSKIRTLEDLFHIRTLGFRGEALASIAAVSRLKIRSAVEDGSGTELVSIPGQSVVITPVGIPKGTTVEVSDLFFNVPARLKFLKSPPVELSHITRIVHTYALAYPDVAFSLFSDGKKIYASRGNGFSAELFRGILDRAVAESLHHFCSQTAEGTVEGWIASPEFFSRTPRGMFLFINRRPVRILSLYQWIHEAVQEILPQGNYPFLILFLNLPHEALDVNVHPTKNEVRFVSPVVVRILVTQAIRDALSELMKTRGVTSLSSSPLSLPTHTTSFQVIGQVFDTYITVQEGSELLLIDQHVAAERALFEALRLRQRPQTRELLLPLSVPLPPHLLAIAKENQEALQNMGFSISFTADGLEIHSLPFFLPPQTIPEQLRDALETLSQSSGISLRGEEEAFKSLACKLAVKANTRLPFSDLQKLYLKWKESRFPFTCPHGRPVFFRITREQIEQRVGRR
ncbi:MAG: DNA mismatch repair endonuclease MutL [bacterium]